MTAIAGVVALDERPVERERLQLLAQPVPGDAAASPEMTVDGHAGLACALGETVPESVGAARPLRDAATGVVAVIEGRLDNRDELRTGLGASAAADDADYVLRAYLEWGTGSPARLLGDYALAIWDPRDGGRLLIACDPMGARPLYYALEDGLLLFASTLEQLLAGLRARPEVDAHVTLGYLYRPLLEQQAGTFLRGVHTVRGGEVLVVAGGRATKQRFWHWRDEPPERHEARGDEVEEFRALCEEAVRCRLRSSGPVALLLSGGLDSSSIASIAATVAPDDDLRTYSFAFERFVSMDERRYSTAVAAAHSLPQTLVTADDAWTLSRPDTVLAMLTEPLFGPYDGLYHRTLPVAGGDGAHVLITGRGGDMLLMGSAKYLATWLLEGRWGSLREQLDRKRETGRFGYAYQLAAWGVYPLVPAPVQRVVHRARYGLGPLERWMPPHVRRRYREEKGRLVRTGRFAWWHELHDDVVALARSSHTLYFDRLVRRYGLESRHPLLDARLADFALRTPPDVFFRDGISRWVLVEALADLLPEIVRHRRDKTPAVALLHHGLREERAGFVRALLEDSELQRRGYVLGGPWKEDVERYLAGADTIPLWPSLSIEMWLRHREGRLPAMT